jgi:hypothetical protein
MGFFDILPGAARRAQRLGFCSSLTYFQVLNRGNKTASTEGSGWEARGNQRLSEVRSGMKLKKCKPLTLLGARASYNPWLCSPELPSLLVTEPSCPAPELGYLWCWQWRSCGWCCTGPSRPKQSPGLATVSPVTSSALLPWEKWEQWYYSSPGLRWLLLKAFGMPQGAKSHLFLQSVLCAGISKFQEFLLAKQCQSTQFSWPVLWML